VRWTDHPVDVPSGGTRIVLAAAGPLSGRVEGTRFDLGHHDTLLLEGAECAGLELAGRWLDTRLVPLNEGSPT
jgi:hypothetical protein